MSVYLTVLVTALITSIVSSVIGAIVGAVISRVKLVRKAAMEAKQEAKKTNELLEQLTMMTCRLAIYNDHFSNNEKLEAYDIYRAHGWNHETKKHMDKILGMDVDEYLERHRRKEH